MITNNLDADLYVNKMEKYKYGSINSIDHRF